MARSILYFSMTLIFSVSLESCLTNSKDKGIVGKWNRQSDDSLSKVIEGEKANWGDITFLEDSTFTINGDAQEDTSTASIPGWHVGGVLKGKYSIDENQLSLKPEEWKKTLFSLNYKIVELTNKKLVLLSTFDKEDTTKYIVYSRYE